MRWTLEYKEQIKEKMGLVLIKKPNASKYDLAKILGIDKDTALRLRKEIRQESLAKADNQKIAEEIGKLENLYNHLKLECWKIIDGDTKIVKTKDDRKIVVSITIGEKLDAIKTIMEKSEELFRTKLDSGIFQRRQEKDKIGESLSRGDKKLIEKILKTKM